MSGRINTGISGFDTMLDGGFLPQTTNLIEGPPGCGKSTLGMQFIYQGTQQGQPGIILTFEELPEQYYRDAEKFGWNFRELERAGLLKIVMSSPDVTKADLEHTGGILERTIREMGAQRIVVDSITNFEMAMQEYATVTSPQVEGVPQGGGNTFVQRDQLYSFLNSLKRQGLTSMIVREALYLFGDGEDSQNDSAIHFIVDSYTMLRYVEIESAVKRAIIVLKMRGSAHDSAIRQFEIGDSGSMVMKPFEGQEGIMSGIPNRMANSFIKAFVRK
jgi:circadian clock protein KaiC